MTCRPRSRGQECALKNRQRLLGRTIMVATDAESGGQNVRLRAFWGFLLS